MERRCKAQHASNGMEPMEAGSLASIHGHHRDRTTQWGWNLTEAVVLELLEIKVLSADND